MSVTTTDKHILLLSNELVQLFAFVCKFLIRVIVALMRTIRVDQRRGADQTLKRRIEHVVRAFEMTGLH